jgi:hypothetical protein
VSRLETSRSGSLGRAAVAAASVVVVAVAVLLVGCSGGQPLGGDGPPSPSPSVPAGSPTPTGSAEPVGPTEQDLAIEFAFQAPDEPCPPVSALTTLPPVDGEEYILHDPFLDERDTRFLEICTYKLAGVGEDDIVLQDHVHVSAHFTLFRQWAGTELYRPLPISVDDLAAWSAVRTGTRLIDPWREGCAPATPCPTGEEPTVRTRGHESLFAAHAGNLEFYVNVVYIAERLPPDVEERTVAIFRELALAAIAERERVD